MNAKDGYLATNHGEDMLHGWHGGPTEGESYVPMMFNMPGPDIITDDGKTNPAFVHDGFDGVYKYTDDTGVERIVIAEAKGGTSRLGPGIKVDSQLQLYRPIANE